ncbi:hypothetical protein DPV78_003966 [Talaromyces pinophilus]|nr:hypothetical protein DPV78_003966 [Talaromyces pinophilus]
MFTQDNLLTLVCQDETFVVHQSIIFAQSEVLRQACTGDFVEGLTKKIEVHFDKETLQYMLYFMYRGTYSISGPGNIEQAVATYNRGHLRTVTGLEARITAEGSSIEGQETVSMFDMLQPHILVNSIADYYKVPELMKQANKNICHILEQFWSGECIGAAVDLAFASTSDTEPLAIMTTAVTDHMTDVINRKHFLTHQLVNQFSLGVIQELFKKLMFSQHKLMQTEQKVCDMMVEGKNKVDSLKQKVSDLEARLDAAIVKT